MSAGFFYPQRMGRIILQAMEEVMGRESLHSLLHGSEHAEWIRNAPAEGQEPGEGSLPFESVSSLHAALEQAYGTRSGRGIALRIGRASFNYGLREFGSQLDINSPDFRLLPLPLKIRAGVQSVADLFNQNSDQVVQVHENDDHITWNIERCPLCWGRKSEDPVCHLAVGLLQESLYWLSGGKIFDVEETHCIARGDESCSLRIDRQPLA
jgi:predicted hydrocarbon binding protein